MELVIFTVDYFFWATLTMLHIKNTLLTTRLHKTLCRIVNVLYFLTQLQGSLVQGQLHVIFVLRLVLMATVIIAQLPQRPVSLPRPASPDRKQVSEHREKGTCEHVFCNHCSCYRIGYILFFPFLFCFPQNRLRMDVQKRSNFRMDAIAIKFTLMSAPKVILVGFLHCDVVRRFLYYWQFSNNL